METYVPKDILNFDFIHNSVLINMIFWILLGV